MNISDRLGEAPERERLPLTSKSLAEELGFNRHSGLESGERKLLGGVLQWGERR
jgi:hypothetical protein